MENHYLRMDVLTKQFKYFIERYCYKMDCSTVRFPNND